MPTSEKSTIEVAKSTVIASLVLSAGLIVVCALLFHQNWELRVRVREVVSKEYAPEPGTPLMPLQGRDIHGNPLLFDYAGESRPTLMLVFSSSCGICDDNWPQWDALRLHLPEDRVRVLAVDLSSTADLHFLLRHGLDASSVVSAVEPKCSAAHKFRLVPQTMLVDAEGTLIKAYFGLLADAELAEIKEFLLALPGTQSTSRSRRWSSETVGSRPSGYERSS